MNLIQFLAMKLHQVPLFIDGMVNSTQVVVHSKDEFREGRPKSVVTPKTIDDVRQLILQDRHLTYCEVEPRHTRAICVVYSNLKDSSRPKNGIKS